MATGRVIRFDEVRGYGFISPDNGSADVFVHANDLLDGKDQYRPGLHVVFEIEDGERGPKASHVRIAEPMTALAVESISTAAPIPIGTASKLPARTDRSDIGSGVPLPVEDLRHELTEALLGVLPALTGDQILHARSKVIALAATHHWLEA
ncbi:MAG TPA: cold shock domain-containing protein [Kineosporiaceae bacterium]|nr:cold shock domain-containing protein [Kineosporiaceae bacterium]